MYYNFVLVPKTLRVTPAMAAVRLWEMLDVVVVLEAWSADNPAALSIYSGYCSTDSQ